MMRTNALAAILAMLLLGASAGQSRAQFGGPMGGMGGPHGGGRADCEKGRDIAATNGNRLVATIQQQLDSVHYELKLRDDQEQAWQAYQDKVEAFMTDQLRVVPAPAESGNALRQIDRKTDIVRNRLAAMEDIADAARHMYERLDSRQRATADRLLAGTVPVPYSGLDEARPSGRDGPDGGRPDGRGPPRE